MKAAIRLKYGSPDTIKIMESDIPTPNKDEILLKVHATTVNRTDCANLTAKPFIMRFVLGFLKPRKTILGTDFAGSVIAKGSDVKRFNIGDKLFGFDDMGASSQAEYIIVSKDGNILPIPENIDYKKAAASIEGAHYAYTFIHKVVIKPGQKILINGATGAIGSSLLQFVKQFNVTITATCHKENIELIKSLGADKIYDYTTEDFTKDQEKYDFIFDAVGKSTFRKCKPLLTHNGIYISSEVGSFAQNIFFALTTPIISNKKVIFPKPFRIKQTMPYISNLLTKNTFTPLIDREYSLDTIPEAYEYVLSEKKIGNVIITI